MHVLKLALVALPLLASAATITTTSTSLTTCPSGSSYTTPSWACVDYFNYCGSGKDYGTCAYVCTGLPKLSLPPCVTTTSHTSSPTPVTTPAPTWVQTSYAQCAGLGYSGPTICATKLTCTTYNAYYGQCLPTAK